MAIVQSSHSDHRGRSRTFPLTIIAHHLKIPMNVGSLFRMADALGVERLVLSGTTPVPPNRKIHKTSRATERRVPFSHVEDPLPEIARLKAQGYTVMSLELTSSSRNIRDVAILPNDKIGLILGAENHGVSQALLEASDHTVHIPMLGGNSSMNVAMACAIAAFEITGRLGMMDPLSE